MKNKNILRLAVSIIMILVITLASACTRATPSPTTIPTTTPYNNPPTVSSTVPDNAATGVTVNSAMSATFSEAMDPSTITNVTFIISNGVTPVSGAVTYIGVTATFTPDDDLSPNTNYTATITTGAKDLAGNSLAIPYKWSGTTGAAKDITAPLVSSTTNANSATNVPVNTKVGAFFSKALDPLTVNTITFIVSHGVTPVPGTVTYAGVTATFTPDVDLSPNTNYTATITTGIKDLTGNALANPYIWNWMTGSVPDTTPPAMTSTIPANGAVGIPINQKISATFSETMDPLTINTASFTLMQGTTPVVDALTYAGVTATFTPLTSLAPNTTYTATITTGAKDLAGNTLANSYIWTFTTGEAPDTTLPIVSSTTPVNTAMSQAVNSAITSVFSEAMDPLTINTATFTLMQGTIPVSGTVTYVGLTATFAPDVNLTPSTIYTATITTGAKDLAGNVLANNYTWSFKTYVANGGGGGGGTPIAGDSTLSNLTISFGTLTPTFASGTISYTDNVANSVSSITVTPTVNESHATVTVNTIAVASASPSGAISLVVGANTITVLVTAQDTTTKTYTVTVNRAALVSGDSTLSNLTISSGTLTPTFASGTISYTDNVANSVSSITVSPTVNESHAIVTVNTVTVASASPSGAISLVIGANTITVLVTAQDITTKTYTLTVTRAASVSGDSTLSNLTVSSGTITPTFASGTISYTDSVANSVSSITVTPTVNESHATVTVNTIAVASGSPSGAISLVVGANTITVLVTAQDTTTKIYTLTVNVALAANPTAPDLGEAGRYVILASQTITTTGGTAISGGDIGILEQARSYFLTGGFTPVGTAGDFTQLTGGTSHAWDDATPAPFPSPLHYSTPVIGAVWTGTNKQALIDQSRADLGIAYSFLTAQTLPAPAAIPGLDPTELGGKTLYRGIYVSAVPVKIQQGDLTLDAQGDPNSVWIFQLGNTLTTGAPGGNIILTHGAQAKNVYWQVAGAGTTGVTIVSVAGTHFYGNVLSWKQINVTNGVIITGSLSSVTAQVTLIGDTVTKFPSAFSSDSTLSNLTISSGTITPTFASGTISYTDSVANSVSSITVTPTVNESHAIVTVNTIAVASGSPSGAISLVVGTNTITVLVTAQDNTTRTYTMTVTRAP